MAERTIESGTAVIRAMAEWCGTDLIEDLPRIIEHVEHEARTHEISPVDAMDIAVLGAMEMMRQDLVARIRKHPKVKPGMTPQQVLNAFVTPP